MRGDRPIHRIVVLELVHLHDLHAANDHYYIAFPSRGALGFPSIAAIFARSPFISASACAVSTPS